MQLEKVHAHQLRPSIAKNKQISKYLFKKRNSGAHHLYGQMVLNKGAKAPQWGKDNLFNKYYREKLDIHMQKNEVGPLPYTMYKKLATMTNWDLF